MLIPGFPTSDKATPLAAVRRDLEGAVVRDVTGKMRSGIFHAHSNDLVARRPDMRLDVLDFRAVQDKQGACFFANQGTTQSPAFAAAPAANRRIDVLYATQLISTIDGTTETKFGVVQGAASPTPIRPALPPAVADAIPLYAVEIPAGATSMQSAGVILTPLFPYTAMAGGTVVVRNSVELAAWNPADGSSAFNLADTSHYVRQNGQWGGGSQTLWSGSSWMNETHNHTLSGLISSQPTGIVLAWSAYSSGAPRNHDWNYHFVPKAQVEHADGAGVNFSAYVVSTLIRKYLYIRDDGILGFAGNGSAPNNGLTLRRVIGV